MTPRTMDRRTVLRRSALVPAAPALLGLPVWAEAEQVAFVDTYRTNVAGNRTRENNAAIGGLGPLAELYRAGAKVATGITTAPEGTLPTKIDDAIPVGAPAGSALGAGSYDSELGQVARLVDTLRGGYASGNPSKYTYQYPRPWRSTADNRVVDTGRADALGFPVYRSDVVVAPQLLRQRNASPTDDAGFPSGHTNAFHLACLALSYAIPERFQELVARAYDLSDTRIVAGTLGAGQPCALGPGSRRGGRRKPAAVQRAAGGRVPAGYPCDQDRGHCSSLPERPSSHRPAHRKSARMVPAQPARSSC